MKKILFALIGIVFLILLAAAILPENFKIEQEVVINKPQSEVFEYLKMMKNENEWSPWIKKDPKIVQNFTGEDGTVGFIASWSGNDEVGAGEQEIVKITPDERIDFELRFIKPMKAKNNSYLITEAISETKTKVKWGMIGRTKFPFNIVCFFMQKKVANEFANGLDNLKTILEK